MSGNTPDDGHAAVPRLEVTHEDDPRVVQEAAAEDYALHVVPRTWRMKPRPLFQAWWGTATAMFYLVVSGTVTLAVGTTNALIGIALAIVVDSAIGIYLSRHAARHGVNVALMSRSMFGYVGASIATLIFAAVAIYYVVFEGSIVALSFQQYFGSGNIDLWYLVAVGYLLPLVLRGVRVWIDKLESVLLPLYIAGLAAAVIWAIAKYGYSGSWASYQPTVALASPGWVFAFTTYIGIWIIMMYTVDFARFARPQDEKVNRAITFGPAYYLFMYGVNGICGIFLAQTIPVHGGLSETSVATGIIDLMGIVGLLFVIVTQTRINVANLYLASTNAQSFFSRAFKLTLPRWIWVLVCMAIAYAIMLTNVFSFILRALQYQGVVVVAWVSIAVVHLAYAARRHGTEELEVRPGRVPRFNPAGVGAWVIASAVGITLIAGTSSFGGTWGLPITAVTASGVYGLSLTFASERWFTLRRPNDPRGEVDDVWEARVRCSVCDRSYIAVEMDRDPSNHHEPICAGCATGARFYGAALEEARQVQGGISAHRPVPASDA